MKKFFWLIILVIQYIPTVYAQNIGFEKISHDFGQIISMDFPPATFVFKNISDKPLAIITAKSAYETKVQYRNVYIQPGETGIIYVRYESQQLGPFADDIQVFFNLETEPVKLHIEGEIISVAECFFDKTNMNVRKVHVIDLYTKEPVPNAQVDFYYNGMTKISAETDRNGEKVMELPIGMYEIDLRAEEYKPRSLSMYIKKSQPVIFLEMEPLPKQETVEEPVDDVAPIDDIEPIDDVAPVDEVVIVDEDDPVEIEQEVLPVELYSSNNIVFVIDVSLSMKRNNKMTYLKKAMYDLVDVLRNIDNVTIITYNNDAYVTLESVRGDNKRLLKQKIRELEPEGLTNGVKGLDLAYQYAKKDFIEGGNNQLILATDGEFTGSTQSEDELVAQIEENARRGIIMSIVGFGEDKEGRNRLKKMSKVGGGQYLHILSIDDTMDLLINEIKQNSLIQK